MTDLITRARKASKDNSLWQYVKSLLAALADALEAMTERAEKAEAERDAAVEDLYEACKRSPCNSGICAKKNCTGNIIPCEFEWRGAGKEGRNDSL